MTRRYNRHGHISFLSEERRPLVMSLANGFDFDALSGSDRFWLRRRRLVNHTGTITDRGHQWARAVLAEEADNLVDRDADQLITLARRLATECA